jgi:hypothetical protein
MGLQQDVAVVVADDVGEELVMVADRRQALTDTLFLTSEDIDDGESSISSRAMSAVTLAAAIQTSARASPSHRPRRH